MLKIILDTRGIMKRMFTGAVERWTEEGRPRYLRLVETWESSGWVTLSATEILGAVCQLAEGAIDAYGALVSGVIPAAWMSEAWFTFTYKFYKRKGDPSAPTFLMGFDSIPIQAEKALYDLALEIRENTSIADYLTKTKTTKLVNHLNREVNPTGVDPDQWGSWSSKFMDYLQKFGHMIYNLDFGNPVPADEPAPVLEALKLFLRGEGADPYERQHASEERRLAAIQGIESRLRGRRLKAFRKNLVRAQKYAPLREDGLADVGLSYPLLRKMLRELGARFVKRGMIKQLDDVFWLTQEEVEIAVSRIDSGLELDDLSDTVPHRKSIREAAQRLAPPLMLPQLKLFGVDLVALKQGGLKAKKGDFLKGVAASPGTVSAPACVLHGPEDFSKMRTGDILVASLTTPAWTPLFTRAAAVVTDIGGPLSHGSIVAREYGIPAVLGTGSATERISSGQIITVDGSAGVVSLTNTSG
jgi:pyruvate,water dikinase